MTKSEFDHRRSRGLVKNQQCKQSRYNHTRKDGLFDDPKGLIKFELTHSTRQVSQRNEAMPRSTWFQSWHFVSREIISYVLLCTITWSQDVKRLDRK